MWRQEKRDRRSWRNEGKTFVEECTGVGRRKGGNARREGKCNSSLLEGRNVKAKHRRWKLAPGSRIGKLRVEREPTKWRTEVEQRGGRGKSGVAPCEPAAVLSPWRSCVCCERSMFVSHDVCFWTSWCAQLRPLCRRVLWEISSFGVPFPPALQHTPGTANRFVWMATRRFVRNLGIFGTISRF